MLNPRRFENSRPDGFPVLEVVEEGEPRKARRFVPLQRTELRGVVSGPLADLILTQEFSFTRAQYDAPIEALYRFPLPGDAAVTGVNIRVGDAEILAELKERAAAEEEYDQAKKEGRQAALTTRESPDVFTLRVTGIQPDQPVRVETRYVQLARAEAAGWHLRIPLTTAPRYTRQDEVGSRHTEGQPLALMRDPGHRFALSLVLEGAAQISSSTHALETSADGRRLTVRLRDGEVIPDRDCVLAWQPVSEGDRPSVQVMTHADSGTGQLYFLAQVSPHSSRARPNPAPREIVLLVDHSGSMGGAKWEAADWAVKKFLWGLTDADRFNLCLFHSTTRWFSKTPAIGSRQSVDSAVAFLEKHRESGGTELGVALEQALHQRRVNGEMARHILIVTDAEVSDAGRILHLARSEYGREGRRRISVLCIDAAPNSLLATQLAEAGGGVSRFLTSSPEEEDIATALDEILEDWAAPELLDVRLELDRESVQATGRRTSRAKRSGWSAVDLGDLPAGRLLWVAGRAPAGAEDLSWRLTAGDREIAFGRLEGPQDPREAIKPLFGARRVLALEYLANGHYTSEDLKAELKELGYDPAKIVVGPSESELYAENAMAEARDALRNLIVREALEFGVASSETGFVATRTEKGSLLRETVVVPNALPSGWSEGFLGGGAMGAVPVALAVSAMPPAGSHSRHMSVYPTQRRRSILREVGDAIGSMLDARADASTGYDAVSSAEPGVPPGRLVARLRPTFAGDEALLFDSRLNGPSHVPYVRILRELRIEFPDGAPDSRAIPSELALLVYIGDPTSPRARIRLVDLARQGWKRPLNLRRSTGEDVRIVLVSPDGTWMAGAPEMEVFLNW